MIGQELACAVMRVTTRHGRLYPGLAPKIEGPVVNSEAGDITPADKVPWLNWFSQVWQAGTRKRYT